MKTLLRVLVFSIISLTGFAQVQTFKGDTTATTQSTRINIGANSSGRVGQKGNSGNFSPFALVSEVVAATAGGITSVNGKTGTIITLLTTDIAEGVNQYYTVARSRSALSATGPIVYNSSTGAFTFSGSKTDVGLGNVDNTSDATKPVSGPQQTALNLKQDAANAIYTDQVANYAALTAYTVPAGKVYLIKVVNDDSQAAPYNTNQYYLKDSAGVTFKFSLIKQ